MTYDERPWLKFYDKGVDPDISIPNESYFKMIEDSFSDFAERPALHFMGTTLTFRQVDEYSRRFSTFLTEIGCGPGDIVGINLPNIPQYLIACVGTLRAGCIVSGVSPLLTGKEVAHQLNDCGARVLVTLDAIFEHRLGKLWDGVSPKLSHVVAAGLADFMPWLKRNLGKLLKKIPSGKVSSIPGKTVISFNDLLATYPDRATKAGIELNDTCLIQYTGGTTGLPKGAELTHRNMLANACQFKQWFDIQRGNEVFLSGFPFFHIAGLAVGMIGLGMGGTQILIPDPRNTNHICKEYKRYLPTGMANVSSLYQMLLDDPMFKTLDFSRLKLCISGAAPLAGELYKAMEAVVGKGKVVEVYGMTETSPLTIMNLHKGIKKIGKVGIPIQSTRIKIVDLETGTVEVPVGQEGEIICNGPQVMKGYYRKPEETDHALRDFKGEKWIYTGDVARMDEDGFFVIVDRAKDMLNVGGYKVFSREVEEILFEHPAVESCAIIGTPDPKRPGAEQVKAVIQLTKDRRDDDSEALAREITEYCRENMAPYKAPKIIEFVDMLPLTAVGKVDKKALR